jgi:plastocyanin
MRKSVLPWLACALIAVIVVPALAWGASAGDPRPVADASFHTGDNFFQDDAGGVGDNTVTIAPGQTVSFASRTSDPLNGAVHNVDFDFDTQPASCNQTELAEGQTELDLDGKAPVPASPLPPGWVGECTFTTSGTYKFFCQAHGGMEGTVVVTGTVTPTPTATPTVTATPTATATPTGPTLTAHDSGPNYWWQDASSSSTTDNSVTVKAGDRVTFNYPSGSSVHNVTFPTGPAPTTCVKTAGPGADDGRPPLPDNLSPPGWEGYCQFDAVGTYSFV